MVVERNAFILLKRSEWHLKVSERIQLTKVFLNDDAERTIIESYFFCLISRGKRHLVAE
jgi:hypothetical protein